MSRTQKKVLYINDLKAIKVFKKPFTKEILNSLKEAPLTASEIAESISFPKDKIYYHIKKLISMRLLYVASIESINGVEQKRFFPLAETFKIKRIILNKDLPKKVPITVNNDSNDDVLLTDSKSKIKERSKVKRNSRFILQRRIIPDRRYSFNDKFNNIERRSIIQRNVTERRISQLIKRDDIKLSIKNLKLEKKYKANKLVNYNLQLNGVKDAISFVHTDSTIIFTLIRLEVLGFVVKESKSYLLPLKINGLKITTLPELIINVYNQYFSKKSKRKIFIAIHSNTYSYKMTYIDSYHKNKRSFSKWIITKLVKAGIFKKQNNIFDFQRNKETKTAVCFSNNKEQISYDYKILKEIGLNPRYNTSIPKILLNVHNYYNLGSPESVSIVIYIDQNKTHMVSIYKSNLVSSLEIPIGLKSFVNTLISKHSEKELINETYKDNAIHYLEKFGILLNNIDETIKINNLNINKNNSINKILNKITFEVKRFIKKIKLYNHSKNYRNQNVGSIYIGGVGSHIKNIDKKLSNDLDFKLEKLDKVNKSAMKRFYDSKRNIWVQAKEKNLIKKQKKHSKALDDIQVKIADHNTAVETAKSPERAKYRITRLEIDQNSKFNSIDRLTKKLIKSASEFKSLKDEYMKAQELIQVDTDTITKQLDIKTEGLLENYKEYDYLTKRISEIDFENDKTNIKKENEGYSPKLEYAGQIKKASSQRNKLNEEKDQNEKGSDDLQLEILSNQEKIQRLELKIDSGYDDAAVSEYLINTVQNTAKAFERSLLVHLKSIDRLKKEDLNALNRVGYTLVQNNQKLKEIKNNYENQKVEEIEILVDKPGEKEYAVEVRKKLVPIIDLIIGTSGNLDQIKNYTGSLININVEQSELQKKKGIIENKLKKKRFNKIQEEQRLVLLKSNFESTKPTLESKSNKRLKLISIITQLRSQILKTKDIINNINLKTKVKDSTNQKKAQIEIELKTLEVDLSNIKQAIIKNLESIQSIRNYFTKNNENYEKIVVELKPQIENFESKINTINEEITENSTHESGISNEIKNLLEQNNQIEKSKLQKLNELKELNIKKLPLLQEIEQSKRDLSIELNLNQKKLKKEKELTVSRASNTKKVTIKTFFKKELKLLEKKRVSVQALLLKSTKDMEKSFKDKKKSKDLFNQKVKIKYPIITKLEHEVEVWKNYLSKGKFIQNKLNSLKTQRFDWEEYLEREKLIRDSKVKELENNINRKEKKTYLLFLIENLKRSNSEDDAIKLASSIANENILSDQNQIREFEDVFTGIRKRYQLFMTNYRKSQNRIVKELKPFGGQEKSIKQKINSADIKIKEAQRIIDSFQKKLDVKSRTVEEKEIEFLRFNKEVQNKLDHIQNEINQIPKKQARARDQVSNKLIDELNLIKQNETQIKEEYKINLTRIDADLQNQDLIVEINKIKDRLKNGNEELLINNINLKKLHMNLQNIKEILLRLVNEEKSHLEGCKALKDKLNESKAIFELKDKTLYKELNEEESVLIKNQENEDGYNQRQKKLKLEKINVDNDINNTLKDIDKLKLEVNSPLEKIEKLIEKNGREKNSKISEIEQFNDLVQMEKDFTISINRYDKDIKVLYKTLDTIQSQESSIVKKINILDEDIALLNSDFSKLDKIVESNKVNMDQIGANHLKILEKLDEVQDIYFPTKTMLSDRIDNIYNLIEKNKNQKSILKEKLFELEKRLKVKRIESAKVDNELSQINRDMKRVLELSIDDNEILKKDKALDTVKQKIKSYVDLVEMKSRIKQLFNQITETEKDISFIREKKASLNRSFIENENINKKKITRLEEICSALEKKIMIDKEELSILESKLNVLKRNASNYGSRIEVLEKELEHFKIKAKEHEETLKDLDRSLEQIKEKAKDNGSRDGNIIENTIEIDHMANLGLFMDSKNELNLIPEEDKNDFKYFKSNNILRNSFLTLTTVFALAAYSQKVKIDPLESLLPKKSLELKLLNMRQEMKKEVHEKSTVFNGLELLIKEDKNLSFNMVTMLKYLTQVTPKRFKVTELRLDNKGSKFTRNNNKINLNNSKILISIKGFYGLELGDSKEKSDRFITFLKESGKFKSVAVGQPDKVSRWKTNYEIELTI